MKEFLSLRRFGEVGVSSQGPCGQNFISLNVSHIEGDKSCGGLVVRMYHLEIH